MAVLYKNVGIHMKNDKPSIYKEYEIHLEIYLELLESLRIRTMSMGQWSLVTVTVSP